MYFGFVVDLLFAFVSRPVKIIPVNVSKFVWIGCQCIGLPFTLLSANSCLTHMRHGMVPMYF